MDLLELAKVASEEHMSKRKANLMMALGAADREGTPLFTPNFPHNGTMDEIAEAAGNFGGKAGAGVGGTMGAIYGGVSGAILAGGRHNATNGRIAAGAGLGALAGGAAMGGLGYILGKHDGYNSAMRGAQIFDEIENHKMAAEVLMQDGLAKIAQAIGMYNAVSDEESLEQEIFGDTEV